MRTGALFPLPLTTKGSQEGERLALPAQPTLLCVYGRRMEPSPASLHSCWGDLRGCLGRGWAGRWSEGLAGAERWLSGGIPSLGFIPIVAHSLLPQAASSSGAA